jgi:DmpG-like communication domain
MCEESAAGRIPCQHRGFGRLTEKPPPKAQRFEAVSRKLPCAAEPELGRRRMVGGQEDVIVGVSRHSETEAAQ